jgi:hypothetical protein
MNKEKMIETCKMIAEDARKDAKEFDGKPFTGKTVGQYFGNLLASVYTLANILKEILENE